MALVMSRAARLKPEIRLAEAVSQYEAMLSDSQKKVFRNYKRQDIITPPDTSSVMKLTSEIDRAQRGGSRCFGPRFTTFLHGVQQYVALGDIILGGSQNIMACTIGSLVRMSILAIVSHGSFLETLSVVFMDIGRSIPRYQTMALLYPRSQTIQSQINEYFIVVVNLCRHITTIMQQSLLKKLTSTCSGAEFKSYQTELITWANSIKNEVDLQLAITLESQVKEAASSRSILSRFTRAADQEQRYRARLKLLDACSKYDHETSWRQIRKTGHTRCFAGTRDYEEWRLAKSATALLYSGQLGSGKSVMMAAIVDDSMKEHGLTNARTAYFFCMHDVAESLEARTIVGSLVRQLLESSEQELTETHKGVNHLSFDTMLALSRKSVTTGERVNMILDGLDLCGASTQATVLDFLRSLQEKHCIRLCISARTGVDALSTTVSGLLTNVMLATQPDNGADIEAFIDLELERCLNARLLKVGDPKVALEVRAALIEGSQGMFLWVTLQIQSLCGMETDQEIRTALQDLPQDLPTLYDQILRRARGSGNWQRRVLMLLLAANRPLTLNEMKEALSVEIGNTTWTASQVVNDVLSVLSRCGCLVAVDEEEHTIRVVHASVSKYLTTMHIDNRGQRLTLEAAGAYLCNIILTYTHYGVFNTALVKHTHKPQIDVVMAVSRMTLGSNYAERLLRRRKATAVEMPKHLQDASAHKPHDPSTTERPIHLIDYISIYGLLHVFSNHDPDSSLVPLYFTLLQQSFSGWHTALDPYLHGKFQDQKWEPCNLHDASIYQLAVLFDNLNLVRLLCESDDFSVSHLTPPFSLSCRLNCRPLNLVEIAVSNGNPEMVMYFARFATRRGIAVAIRDTFCDAFNLACQDGQPGIVKALVLWSTFDIVNHFTNGRRLIELAIDEGNMELVDFFLNLRNNMNDRVVDLHDEYDICIELRQEGMNDRKVSLIERAGRRGNVQILHKLVHSGAMQNKAIWSRLVDYSNEKGNDLMELAAIKYFLHCTSNDIGDVSEEAELR